MNIQDIIAEIFEYGPGMWRFRWWAVVAAWIIGIFGWVFIATMPDVYSASARVYVDTNSLLKPLLQGLTATENTLDNVQLVSKALLSRPNLEKVAHATDLDLRARSPRDLDVLISGLQERIHITGSRENIFTITYEDINREKAREVVGAVLDTFVESAIGNKDDDAEVTERALANEIKVHEQRLQEADQALAEFKQKNLGYMPGEYGDYYERLQAAMGNVSATEEKVRLVTQRRDELQRQVAGEEPVFGIMPIAAPETLQCSQSVQLAQMTAQLETLRTQYTDKYPRVAALQDSIDRLKKDCTAEAQASGAVAVRPNQKLEENPVYQNLKIQASNAEVELAELRAQLAAHQSEVAKLKRDVDKITEVEAQLKQLNRDYDVVQARHKQLLSRWEDLQAKKRLDPVTEKVQFQKIDPPYAEPVPVGPKRTMLLGGLLVFALGSGIVLAFGLNQIRPVFFTGAALRLSVEFPVIGAVGMLMSPQAAKKQRRKNMLWVATCALLILSAGAAVVFAGPSAAVLRSLLQGAGA